MTWSTPPELSWGWWRFVGAILWQSLRHPLSSGHIILHADGRVEIIAEPREVAR